MIPAYKPATREQMEKMTPQELITQYQSLVDLIKETREIPFEREPRVERDELIRLIDAGQVNYFNDVFVGSLIE